MSGEMQQTVDKVVGKTVDRVEVRRSSIDNWECAFTMYFTDGTSMDVSSQAFNDQTSIVSVDVS